MGKSAKRKQLETYCLKLGDRCLAVAWSGVTTMQ